MVQEVKGLVAKPDDPSLTPRTCIVEGATDSCKFSSDQHMIAISMHIHTDVYIYTSTYTHTYTYKHI